MKKYRALTDRELYLENLKKEKRFVGIHRVIVLVFMLAVWELLARFNLIDSFIMSQPSRIAETFINMVKENLILHIYTTCYETIVGFVLGIILGIAFAILLWWFETFAKICDPYIVVLNALPKIALGPIIIVLVGAGTEAIIFMALAISLIVTIMQMYNGFQNTSNEKCKMLQSFGANKFQVLTKVVIPSNISTLFSSMKINIGLSLVGVIAGEFLVSKAGLGYLIVYGGQVFRMDLVMTAVLSGGVDIGFAGPEASIYVYNEGKENYCQVFAQVTKRDGSFLISREKYDDFKWDDLAGKVVLPGRKGGVPYMTLLYVISQKGLALNKDVFFNDTIQFDLMASSFTNGIGDFVTAFEPVATSIEESGKGHIVASIGEESGEIPYTAYFAAKNYIEENSALIERFTRALYKGQLWVRDHTAIEIAHAIAPSFPDTDIAVLEKVAERYKNIDAWCDTPVLKEESFEKLQTVMSEAGELKQKAPYADVVNNTFAEKVVK